MTIKELLENAHLDALGLLDPEEQAAFEKAFTAAPPRVQAHVRADQARWADASPLLPDVQPSPALREKVLGAVSAAILVEEGAQADASLELRPSRRVAPWWRTVSFGMLTAAVILGATSLYVFEQNRGLQKQISSSAITDGFMGQRMGAKVVSDTLLDPTTRTDYFARSDAADAAGFDGSAALRRNTAWEQPIFFCKVNRVEGVRGYRLVVLDANNRVAGEPLADLAPGNDVKNVAVPATLAVGTRLAVIAIASTGAFDPARDVMLTLTI
ncbi:hypothetical protein PHYC_00960 [Phycisphaerales bacterium]|nr:hypothetical protein PHYC_00960 [Phycisphaerales bacterium]